MKKKLHVANITTQQLSFIKLLDEYEINIFTLSDIEKRLNQKFKNLRGIADKLALKGFQKTN